MSVQVHKCVVRTIASVGVLLGVAAMAEARQAAQDGGVAHGIWVQPGLAPGVLRGTLRGQGGAVQYDLEAELTRFAFSSVEINPALANAEFGGIYGTLRAPDHATIVAGKIRPDLEIMGTWGRLADQPGQFDAMLYLIGLHPAAPIVIVGSIQGMLDFKINDSAQGGAEISSVLKIANAKASNAVEKKLLPVDPKDLDPDGGSSLDLGGVMQAGHGQAADAAGIPGHLDLPGSGTLDGDIVHNPATVKIGHAVAADFFGLPAIVDPPAGDAAGHDGMAVDDIADAGSAVEADAFERDVRGRVILVPKQGAAVAKITKLQGQAVEQDAFERDVQGKIILVPKQGATVAKITKLQGQAVEQDAFERDVLDAGTFLARWGMID